MEPVFVFGSNLAGRHGAGAARFAVAWKGAMYGKGKGPSGNSYAVPTKDAQLKTLPLDVIAGHVREFISYARRNPVQDYEISRLGCGLAGYKDKDIAPFFKDAPKNCVLPGLWRAYYEPSYTRLLVIADWPDVTGEKPRSVIRAVTTSIASMSKGAGGIVFLGHAAAVQNLSPFLKLGVTLERVIPDWKLYGDNSVDFAYTRLYWMATTVVVFDNGTEVMALRIRQAKENGLPTEIIKVGSEPVVLPAVSQAP